MSLLEAYCSVLMYITPARWRDKRLIFSVFTLQPISTKNNFRAFFVGKNAEILGKDCCVYGCLSLIPFVNIFVVTNQRGEIRERSGIPGSCCGDLVCVCCCGLCTLTQEARELEFVPGMSMVRE